MKLRISLASPRVLVWSTLALLAGTDACSANASRSDAPPADAPIAECDAYVNALSTCLKSAGALDVTKDSRADVVARFAAAAKGDEATRARYRAKCAEGHKALAGACGATL